MTFIVRSSLIHAAGPAMSSPSSRRDGKPRRPPRLKYREPCGCMLSSGLLVGIARQLVMPGAPIGCSSFFNLAQLTSYSVRPELPILVGTMPATRLKDGEQEGWGRPVGGLRVP